MPTFAIYLLDKSDEAELRRATRAAHLAYIADHKAKIVFGGPFWGADGRTRIGGLTVLDVPDLSAAEAFVAGDPYAVAGLFETVSIHRMQIMIPESAPGEIERERARMEARGCGVGANAARFTAT